MYRYKHSRRNAMRARTQANRNEYRVFGDFKIDEKVHCGPLDITHPTKPS